MVLKEADFWNQKLWIDMGKIGN